MMFGCRSMGVYEIHRQCQVYHTHIDFIFLLLLLPSPRIHHALFSIYIYIYMLTWIVMSQIPRTVPWPQSRGDCIEGVIDGQFIVYGGFGATAAVPDDVWYVCMHVRTFA